MFGWLSEEDEDGPNRGWQGLQSLPRLITFNPQLLMLQYHPYPSIQNTLRLSAIPISFPSLFPGIL